MRFRSSFLIIGLVIASTGLVLAESSAPSPQAVFPYYADIPNPPVVEREPPYENTRRQIEKTDSHYLHIRYPHRKVKPAPDAPDAKALYFRITVGNELVEDIYFQVQKIELKAGGVSKPLKAIFTDEKTPKKMRPFETLAKTWITARPSHFGEVIFYCTECSGEDPELELSMDVFVHAGAVKEHMKPSIKLYRGIYKS